jgi:hypothetical protein
VKKYVHVAKAISNICTVLWDVWFTKVKKVRTETTDKRLNDELEDRGTEYCVARTHDLEMSAKIHIEFPQRLTPLSFAYRIIEVPEATNPQRHE